MQTVEEAYAAIGQAIADAIPEPWDEASVVASDLEEDTGAFETRYRPRRSGAPAGDFDVDVTMLDAFEVLHREIRGPDGAPWTRATFTLRPDGTFGLDFDYGDRSDGDAAVGGRANGPARDTSNTDA